MPRNAVTLAERFRTARESFELGLKLGCSPAMARETMRQQEAQRRWEETGERQRAAMAHRHRSAAPSLVNHDPTTPATPRRWWLD